MVESPLNPSADSNALAPQYTPVLPKPAIQPPMPAYMTVKPEQPAPVTMAPQTTPQPAPQPTLQPTTRPAAQQGAAPDPMANLARMAGVDVKTGGDYIRKYLQDGGVGLNPKELAWCAAAMNASLAQVGLPGTGSQRALSFLNYGTPVTEPQHGDIVVFQRGGPNSGLGHVGYVDKINPDGTIRVLGGNQSEGVGYATYDTKDVLGYRRIPGAEAVTDPSQIKDTQVAQGSSKTQAQAQEAPKTPVEAAGDALQKGMEGAAKAEEKQKPYQLSPLAPVEATAELVVPTRKGAYEALMEKVPSMQGGAARTPAVQQTPAVAPAAPKEREQNEQQA